MREVLEIRKAATEEYMQDVVMNGILSLYRKGIVANVAYVHTSVFDSVGEVVVYGPCGIVKTTENCDTPKNVVCVCGTEEVEEIKEEE